MPYIAHDVALPFVKGSDTSAQAAAEKRETVRSHEQQVRAFLEFREAEGATCDEVEQTLDLCHQNASARIRALVLKGLVKDSGERRKTRRGRKAVVWVVVPEEERV